ncbi:MAG: hypothetical protein WC812_02200 [Candidatus Pacearchaeota archaeon]|jgi:hypothetical protein
MDLEKIKEIPEEKLTKILREIDEKVTEAIAEQALYAEGWRDSLSEESLDFSKEFDFYKLTNAEAHQKIIEIKQYIRNGSK